MTSFASLLAVVTALTAPSATPQQMDVPWRVGERAEYEVRFSAARVGTGSMEVMDIVPIRGKDAWHTQFRIKGGTFFFKVNDLFESWSDVTNFTSLRYHSDQDEGPNERVKQYEIFPDRGVYIEKTAKGDGATTERPSVDKPLDDGSFLYFIRTVPLEVGQTYTFNRYFRPDRNPVTIKVLRKERVKVPAGEFDAIVIQPLIKARSGSLFSEEGEAEVWLTDDPSRIMLQMKSKLKIGSINLYLKSYRPGTASPTTR
jgi:hypothetical protein